MSSSTADVLTRRGTATALVGALAAGAGLAVTTLGPPALLLAPLAVGLYLMLTRPAFALGALLGVTVLLEEDDEGFLPVTSRLYEPVVAVASVMDVLLVVLVLSFVLDLGRRGEAPRLPGPFSAPLGLVAAALAAGVVVGLANGGDGYGIALTVRTLAYLLIVPLVTVNVLRTRASLKMFALGAVLAGVYKGVEGTIAWLAGAGHPFGEGTLTYFPPAANLVLLTFLLGLVAAAGERVPLPRWVWAAAPFAVVALFFSYRRSFWIAALLGLFVVLLVGRHRGRLLPIAAALAAAIWAAVALAGGSEAEGLISERARELDLSRIASNPSDRYRLGELRNVREELRANPVLGIGIGVPWTVEHSFSYQPGARNYVHVAVFWYWLKLGLAGLAAYVWLMITALRVAYRVARTVAEPLVRAAGVTLFATFLGIVLLEATATFTGVNVRFTVLVGALLGWLAAASAPSQEAPDGIRASRSSTSRDA